MPEEIAKDSLMETSTTSPTDELKTMFQPMLWLCVVFLGVLLCMVSRDLYVKAESYLSKSSSRISGLYRTTGALSHDEPYKETRIISVATMTAGGLGFLLDQPARQRTP